MPVLATHEVPADIRKRFPRLSYTLRQENGVTEILDGDGKPLRDGSAPFPIFRSGKDDR